MTLSTHWKRYRTPPPLFWWYLTDERENVLACVQQRYEEHPTLEFPIAVGGIAAFIFGFEEHIETLSHHELGLREVVRCEIDKHTYEGRIGICGGSLVVGDVYTFHITELTQVKP